MPVYAAPPREGRAVGAGYGHVRKPPARSERGSINLRLAYRAPLHAAALLDFLELRALPGMEERVGNAYRRGLRLPHGGATVALSPADRWVSATLRLEDVRDLAPDRA